MAIIRIDDEVWRIIKNNQSELNKTLGKRVSISDVIKLNLYRAKMPVVIVKQEKRKHTAYFDIFGDGIGRE